MNTHRAAAALFALAASLSAPSGLRDRSRSTCTLKDVPVTYAGTLGRIVGNDVTTGATVDGALTYENNRPIPVAEVTIIVDYLNHQNERLYTAVYHDGAGNHKRPREFFGRLLGITIPGLRDPLAPGQRMSVLGHGPRASGGCPSEALVTMVDVTFADGSMETYKSPDWRLDPDLVFGPDPDIDSDYLDLPVFLVRGRREFLADARIGSDGKLSALVPRDKDDTDLAVALKDQLLRFTFLPSLENGSPSDSKVLFVVRLHPNSHPGADMFTMTSAPSEPFVVVDLVLTTGDPNKWVLVYGLRAVRPKSAGESSVPVTN
jgi:hypothetical protein